MHAPVRPVSRLSWSTLAALGLLLSACGGGAGNDGGATAGATPASTVLALNSVELAQTHVVPPAGRSFTTADGKTHSLNLIANRAALLMVEPARAGGTLTVEAVLAGASLGSMSLNPPAQLPATDNGMPPYSTSKHSVLLPKEWLQSGVALKISRGGASSLSALSVVGGLQLRLHTQPLFFFGANRTLASAQSFDMDAALVADYAQQIPVAGLAAATLADLSFNDVVLAPNGSQPAQAVSSYAEARAARNNDGFTLMAQMLGLMSEMRSVTANNDRHLNVAYWAPMSLRDPVSGKIIAMGGGLSGVGSGVGDGDAGNYGGIFVHEMGHAYSMGHAGEMYTAGTYPYAGGSLAGSAWGYDAIRKQLLSPLMPALPCNASGRQLDAAGHCYRQDPMQGGGGDYPKNAGYRWSMFADYSSAYMQAWMNERIVYDPAAGAPASPFTKWSAGDGKYIDAGTAVSQLQRDMQGARQVVTAVGNVALGDASLNRLSATAPGLGNLPPSFDPSSQADWDRIKASYPNYCSDAGCDYTLRATFADGSTQNVLLPKGYHLRGSNTVNPDSTNALNAASFLRYAVNFSAAKRLLRLDLYRTEFGAKPAYSALPAASFGMAIASWNAG
ncbi:MAG: hypothetical protein HYZ65_04640 [Burkholderiales bacterium]|nr:hypothetical protein [Burkholderiales bacterium]